MSEIVEVEPPEPAENARWSPVVGPETLDLLDNLDLPDDDPEGEQRLLQESRSSLAQCRPPSEIDGAETGLVIGYVQSGKTTSFTAVAALARDNGFRVIVVCTGVNVNLFSQSVERLERDLRLNSRIDREWYFVSNPRASADVEQMVTTSLMAGRTVLMPVMKNATRLDNMARLLGRLDLAGVPALVIDDEADQASLNNNVQQQDQSATYRRILSLRDLVPHHTFLQYTATPQALLLINLIDVLSPSFANLLTPGAMYTGGRAFFEPDAGLVRVIPGGDLPTASNLLPGAPATLKEALRAFWVGVAAGLLAGGRGNRSMMVHPSQRVIPHADYFNWVAAVRTLWGDLLLRPEEDPDRIDLVEAFKGAYDDLSTTADDLPAFEDLSPRLAEAVRQTIITQVNAAGGRTPEPDWRQFYQHIVVGGDVLNRGVTIEGLTVSYVPRSAGGRQADTLQQRARWFGYKRAYLGLCRVYLPQDVLDLYRAYVDHEEALRAQLNDFGTSGMDLKEWRRAFFLDPQLRPTRNQVIGLDPLRGTFSDAWFSPKSPHRPPEAAEANRVVAAAFLTSIEDDLAPDDGHERRTDTQKHKVALGVSLRQAYEQLLIPLRFGGPRDTAFMSGLLLQIGHFLEENPDATCVVYDMSEGRVRERGLDAADQILNLFQGANYDDSVQPRETLYPGDREIHDAQLTIQIHHLDITDSGERIAADVPAVAVWVPRLMAADWLVQPNA